MGVVHARICFQDPSRLGMSDGGPARRARRDGAGCRGRRRPPPHAPLADVPRVPAGGRRAGAAQPLLARRRDSSLRARRDRCSEASSTARRCAAGCSRRRPPRRSRATAWRSTRTSPRCSRSCTGASPPDPPRASQSALRRANRYLHRGPTVVVFSADCSRLGARLPSTWQLAQRGTSRRRRGKRSAAAPTPEIARGAGRRRTPRKERVARAGACCCSRCSAPSPSAACWPSPRWRPGRSTSSSPAASHRLRIRGLPRSRKSERRDREPACRRGQRVHRKIRIHRRRREAATCRSRPRWRPACTSSAPKPTGTPTASSARAASTRNTSNAGPNRNRSSRSKAPADRRLQQSGFTPDKLNGKLGQTVDYQITVSNTGNVAFTLSEFMDPDCDPGTNAGPPVGAHRGPGRKARVHVQPPAHAAVALHERGLGRRQLRRRQDRIHESNKVVVNVVAGTAPVAVQDSGNQGHRHRLHVSR